MDKVRVYIESALIPRTQVRPVLSGAFSFERESGKVYYRHLSKDAFKFSQKEDYDLILAQREDECGEVTVTVEKRCNGEYVEYWRGFFRVFDSTINYTKCWAEAKPKPLDGYKCLEEALKDDFNVFDAGDVVTATPYFENAGDTMPGDGYETATCFDSFTAEESQVEGDEPAEPYDGCLTDPAAWCLKSNSFTSQCYEDPNTPQVTLCDYEQTTVWHREVATTNCVDGTPVEPTYSSGWTLLEDNCVADGTAKWWRCPSSGGSTTGEVAGPFTRGRLFSDVLQDVVASFGCGLTVKSNFFGINPEGDDPANSAYAYAAANLRAMTMHQKSDIKRRTDTNGSTSAAWEFKGEDFFSDLLTWFNVWYDVEDGVLILEHYSFFTSVLGWGLSAEGMDKQVDYSGNENIRSQKYQYSDKGGTGNFLPTTIMYDCGEEDKDEPLRLFNADLLYIQNPTFRESVADEGFVLIANDLYEGEYVIKDNNAPLAWGNILPALHPWARLYKSGKIGNGPQITFENWLPYIKQQPFKTDYCCGQNFNPQDLITTDLGNGVVTSATHSVFTGRLEIELSY